MNITNRKKISRNAHDQRTHWHSDCQLNCQISLSHVYCTSKRDYYILDTTVSNILIIEEEVLECLNFSIPFFLLHSQVFKVFKVLWIHLVVAT